MKYEYRKAPNPTELSGFTGLLTQNRDHLTLAKDVPCQSACPAHTDVPAYIRALHENDPDKAYRINLEDNVFPSVLGRVCSRPCEDACRHNWTNTQGPVSICHLKRASSDHHKFQVSPLPAWFQSSGKKVAVIGGGPAGLTAARQLVRYGHKVTIFERESHLGGMMVDGIPRFRLPLEEIQKEIYLILDSGVEVKTGQNIDQKALEKITATYDAVLVTTGTVKPKALGLEAPALGILPGLEFMKNYNDGHFQEGQPAKLSGDVVVIGGGFTAVDCARACARAAKRIVGEDQQVGIYYRRTEHHMAADLEELEEIRLENIDVFTLVAPVKVNTENGQLVSVTFQRNKLQETPGVTGKPVIVPIEGSEFTIPCGTLIVAIGQDSDTTLLPPGVFLDTKSKSGDVDAWENPGQRTNHPKIFAAGDFLTGSADVIHAVAEGKAAADEIDIFLTGERRVKHHIATHQIINKNQTGRTRDHDLTTPPAMPLLSLLHRAEGNQEVELGFKDEDIIAHAGRCYQCNHKFQIDADLCIGCNWCIEVAPRNCIKRVSRVFEDEEGRVTDYVEAQTAEMTTFIYIDSDNCIRCGKCLRVCPTGAISMVKMERTPCAVGSLKDLVDAAKADGKLPQYAGAGERVPLLVKA